MKGEALAVQARSHQGQQQRGGADQRHNADALALGPGHQVGTRVGHRRATRLGEQPDVVSGAQWIEELLQDFGPGMFVKLPQLQDLQRLLGACGLQEGACRLRLFDDEVAQRPYGGEYGGRQAVRGRNRTKRYGD